MGNTSNISNPDNYKILIQIKKNRRLRRKPRYLNMNYDFTEDINKAVNFRSMSEAEDVLKKITYSSLRGERPRIILKYCDMLAVKDKTQK